MQLRQKYEQNQYNLNVYKVAIAFYQKLSIWNRFHQIAHRYQYYLFQLIQSSDQRSFILLPFDVTLNLNVVNQNAWTDSIDWDSRVEYNRERNVTPNAKIFIYMFYQKPIHVSVNFEFKMLLASRLFCAQKWRKPVFVQRNDIVLGSMYAFKSMQCCR